MYDAHAIRILADAGAGIVFRHQSWRSASRAGRPTGRPRAAWDRSSGVLRRTRHDRRRTPGGKSARLCGHLPQPGIRKNERKAKYGRAPAPRARRRPFARKGREGIGFSNHVRREVCQRQTWKGGGRRAGPESFVRVSPRIVQLMLYRILPRQTRVGIAGKRGIRDGGVEESRTERRLVFPQVRMKRNTVETSAIPASLYVLLNDPRHEARASRTLSRCR